MVRTTSADSNPRSAPESEAVTLRIKFTLRNVFIVLGCLALGFAVVGSFLRPQPGHIAEAILLQRVAGIREGDQLQELERRFGFPPNAAWLKEHDTGFVIWRFAVSDVHHEASRAMYSAHFENGRLREGKFFYPLESAGGGMRF